MYISFFLTGSPAGTAAIFVGPRPCPLPLCFGSRGLLPVPFAATRRKSPESGSESPGATLPRSSPNQGRSFRCAARVQGRGPDERGASHSLVTAVDFDLTRFLKAITTNHATNHKLRSKEGEKQGLERCLASKTVRIRRSRTAINEKAALRTGKMGILTDILC